MTNFNISATRNKVISKSHMKEYIRNNIVLNILLQDVSIQLPFITHSNNFSLRQEN